MKLTRQQVLDLLIRTKQSGHLPEDGATSLFVHQGSGKPVQLAVTVSSEKVRVRQIYAQRAFFAGIEADAPFAFAARQFHVAVAFGIARAAGYVHGKAHLRIFRKVFDVAREIPAL